MIISYPTSVLLTILTIAIWYLVQNHKILGKLIAFSVIFAIGAYFIHIFLAPDSLQNKFGIIFRDTIVIGIVSLLFQFLSKTRLLFTLGIIGVLVGYFGFYQPILENTFSQNSDISKNDIQLDQKGELLIDLKDGIAQEKIVEISNKYNLEISPAFNPKTKDGTELDDYIVVNIPDNQIQHLQSIKSEFQESGLIDWIEANEMITLDDGIADTPTPLKTNFFFNDSDISKQWALKNLGAASLFKDVTKNSLPIPKKTVLIAILDTGVDGNHEDLKANYQSTKKKYDKDTKQHGTHCAGIAAAVSNNKVGIASMAVRPDNIRVTSITVLPNGTGSQRGIIAGMIEAADLGADVISMSLGGLSTTSRQKAYIDAVKYCNKKGAIVVVAAGNSNANANRFAPANTPGVLVVAATDQENKRTNFSNFTPDQKWSLAAPGLEIFSTVPNNGYASFSGTSMATPYVAGVIGLIKSYRPDITTAQIWELLDSTGLPTNETKNTGKLVQPYIALKKIL